MQPAPFSKQAHHLCLGAQRYLKQRAAFRPLQHERPLIVTLRPASNSLLHYVVVTGIEPEQHALLVNDPAQRKLLKVDARDFEQEWKDAGNWTLLAVPRSDH